MNVIDSSGWLEYFIGGKNASFFAPPIQDAANVVLPTISIFKVFKRALIEKGRTDALEAVAIMYDGKVVVLDREIALIPTDRSFELRLRWQIVSFWQPLALTTPLFGRRMSISKT